MTDMTATIATIDAVKCRSLRPFATLAAGGACAFLLGAYQESAP